MAIPKYTLDYDKKEDDWKLSKQGTGQVVERFETKQVATKGGVLEKAVGPGGGSVRIKTKEHVIQEERTYPGKADPKRSKG
ncbi:DUF2188 domain-containing protein [Caenimonas sedimenti]|uniref:DUF2188 domain-containing protein n=1 Tax=Caenimonas sedimenti TaxID=2596921 RepID=A0A562ZSN2_9BURK|nr:DUF2188 domain-containing protein [Caenimonas sedimenti]TWO71533.1 DUF2188 domain-containing protein [Caenimonas sedimenti]